MEYFYSCNLKFEDVYFRVQSTTDKKDWHQVNAVKDLQVPQLGTRLTVALTLTYQPRLLSGRRSWICPM